MSVPITNSNYGKLFRAKRTFAIYNFEVLKIYCFYEIVVRPDDFVKVGNYDPVWGSALEFQTDAENLLEFAYARVANDDHWFVDLQLERTPGKFGGLITPVGDLYNREGIRPSDVLDEVCDAKS